MLAAPLAAPIEPVAAAGARIITIGESTDAQQRLELLRSFEASGPDDVAIVTLADAAPLDDLFGGAEGVWSSTVLACEAPGAGLTIDTRGNTDVPSALFALPLAAAGVTDASLRMAVPAGAPAESVSALAGVFKTWGIAPCAAPDADGSGRDIALEALVLATDLGASISPDDPAAGVEPAALLILETQGAALATPDRLATVVAAAERDAGIVLPAADRKRLGEFLGRSLAHDWGTLAGGWTLESTGSDTGFGVRFLPAPLPAEDADLVAAIAPATGAIPAAEGAAGRVGGGMVGIASAVLAGAAEAESAAAAEDALTKALSAAVTPAALPAQPGPVIAIEPSPTLTAAEGAATEVAVRATAEARASEAAMTATAEAREAAETAEAAAAMTATAAAPTPTPEPVLSAAPVDIDGTLVGTGSGRVVIAQPGKPQAEFRVARNATIARDGAAGALADLVSGDRVRLTIDGPTGVVTAVSAAPASQPAPIAPLVALALVPMLLAALVLNRRRAPEPFVVVYRPAAAG